MAFPLALLAALACTPAPCAAEDEAARVTGRVVAVRDGDSLVLLAGRRSIDVRLAEIDAPERAQPWGRRSKQALSDLAFGKTVEAEVVDHDRYGRTVARVTADGVDLSAEMVRRGCAWVYRQYASRSELSDLERIARAERVGLWSLPEAERIAPWEWRHARHTRPRLGAPPAAAPAPPTTR